MSGGKVGYQFGAIRFPANNIDDDRDNKIQVAVLVPIIKLTQDGQWVKVRVLSEVVRLQPLDSCDSVWGQVSYFFEAPIVAAGSATPLITVGQDRERTAYPVAWPDPWVPTPLAIVNSELPHFVIERGSEIVNEVAENRSEPWRDGLELKLHQLPPYALAFLVTVYGLVATNSPHMALR